MSDELPDRRYAVLAIFALCFGGGMALTWLITEIKELLFGAALSLCAAFCFAWTAFVERRQIGDVDQESDDGEYLMDESTPADVIKHPVRVNPTTGLPMMNGSIDVHGNPYGQNDKY